MATLVVDKIRMNETPQSGDWEMCFRASQDGRENTFNEPGKKYQGDGIEIAMGLRLPGVADGSAVNFWMGLDDDTADVCGNAEDQCNGSFTAANPGSSTQNPNDDWSFVIHYHLE